MPLKIFKRDRIWYIRGSVKGRRVFESTGTGEREIAQECKTKRERELYEEHLYGPRCVATFAEAVESYLKAETRSASTRLQVGRLLKHFGGEAKIAAVNSQKAADEAVAAILAPDAAPGTQNRTYTQFIAILHHAAHMGWADRPNIRKKKPGPARTNWLTPAQATALIEASADHLRPLVIFVLGVGARMAEAIDLQWEDVHLADARVRFRETKNGRDRIARLPPAAVAALANLDHREGAVFRTNRGETYADKNREGGGQVKRAWRTACKNAGLWADERPTATPHELRHTWATWFYAIAKDPMLLRDEGGWKSIQMVERYAHLAPSDIVDGVLDVWGGGHPRIDAPAHHHDRKTG